MPSGAGPTLLLTRPRADSLRFAALLPEWSVVISPILKIVPVAHDAERLARAEALVFTSAHAVSAAAPGRGRTAFCVGERTAEVARIAGFAAIAGPGDAEGLLPMIEASGLRLVHPHGRHLARDLPIEGMVVYDQLPLPLNDKACALLSRDGDVVLPLFSPRSAHLVAAATRGMVSRLWPVAISAAAMQGWDAPSAGHAIAHSPTQDGMITALRRLGRRLGREELS
jgi:uroporphyrinogen-III synthase